LFLQGARLIQKRFPGAQFLIIGDGPQRAELEAVARRCGVDGATHFLGSRTDVPSLLAACDVVALTSHNEASPVSILEALSVGVPVVAANVGSVQETVVDGQTGWLFPGGDVAAYAHRTIELLGSPSERKRMGAEGRRRVTARWSLAAMVHGYEQLLAGIHAAKMSGAALGSKRARPPAPPGLVGAGSALEA
jgi:glycosyltransferase involved in cell wall biosynthesis